MTKTYSAYFYTDANCATHDFKAETPEAALQLALSYYYENEHELWFEAYDTGQPLNTISILNSEHDSIATWHDDDYRVRLAAPELLAALRQAVAALNTARRFRVSGLGDSYEIAALCDRAIAKAAPPPAPDATGAAA